MKGFNASAAGRRLGLSIVAFCIVTEVTLRLGLGLGSPPLSYADPDYGYAFVAGQELRRFGNLVSYNSLGMRSEGMSPAPGDEVRVLCIGDSVTNGGALTDQAATYPYQLERMLQEEYGRQIRTMNISAGSWAIENQLSYIEKKGLFGAAVVVVQVGSHDLYQNKSTGDKVGNDPNFPSENPLFAAGELVKRYVWPRVANALRGRQRVRTARTDTDLERSLTSLQSELALIRAGGAIPMILFTPNLVEAEEGAYATEGHAGLRALASMERVKLIEMLSTWHEQLRSGDSPYRDGVHPNELGNRVMAEKVAEQAASILLDRFK